MAGAICACCSAGAGYASWTRESRRRILVVTELALIAPAEFDLFVGQLGGSKFLDAANYEIQYLDSKIGDEMSLASAIAYLLVNPPDLLVVFGDDEAVAIRQALPRTPLFFWSNADPTTIGLAETFQRPGGFATGATSDWAGNTKPLELIAEVLGNAHDGNFSQVGVISNERWFASARMLKWNEAATAKRIALEKISAETFASLSRHPLWTAVDKYDAVILPISTPRVTHLQEMVQHVSSRGVVNLFENFGALVKGGAFGYQAVRPNWALELGTAIRLVIQGADVGDIPIRGPDAWTFAVNKSALAQLGVTLKPETAAWIGRVF